MRYFQLLAATVLALGVGLKAQQDGLPDRYQFRCETNSKSTRVPTSVNKLLPGDIKVVAALGDSITAGYGILAESLAGSRIQDRGYVFSIGGQGSLEDGIITLPNILKKYNADLYGYSVGTGEVNDPISIFNLAVGGSTAVNLTSQAIHLIEKMKIDKNVNFEQDWKMVTIFIGGNDLCWVCEYPVYYGSGAFIKHMESALDTLAAGLPRALINVLPVFDVTPLPTMSTGEVCDGIHGSLCPCGAFEINHGIVKKEQADYSIKTSRLINSGKYDKEDFTVVLQPFHRDSYPIKHANGSVDKSYFSPDCFHFTQKAHNSDAIALWNSLFIPVAEKPTTMTHREKIECPPPGTFIKTNQNSRKAPVNMDDNSNDSHFAERLGDLLASKPDPSNENRLMVLTVGLVAVGSATGVLLVMVVVLMCITMKRRKGTTDMSTKVTTATGF